jgi:sugar lactone lactonase YvrE
VLDLTGGKISVVANPGDVDYQWSLDHKSLAPNDFPDSNPYDLVPKPDGGFYVVDAASNTLDSVSRDGDVRVLAFIPNTPAGSDAVPTCLAMGREGTVYIGQLTGDGNSGTAANVYRYDPRNGRLTVWQSGFSAITGCGFGANGDFYVTEFDTSGLLSNSTLAGAVIQISHDGTRTVLGAGQLLASTGFAAGRDGSIYVVNNSIFNSTGTPTGEVVKIG